MPIGKLKRKRKPNKAQDFVCVDCGVAYTLRKKPGRDRPLLCLLCLRLGRQARARNEKYWQRPEYRRKARAWVLQKRYRLTEEGYFDLLELQGGVCAICKSPSSENKYLAVDHDHHRDYVRGLLCAKCNRGLGTFGDDTALLRQAEAYLLRQPQGRPSWDEHFIEFARLAATRSKDASTQVGAVLVRDQVILSTGYNGFPRGIKDDVAERRQRPTKYLYTVHAEENVLLNMTRIAVSALGATLYVTPFYPCMRCATSIIQAGVVEVVTDVQQENTRWLDEMQEAQNLFRCGKVLVRTLL